MRSRAIVFVSLVLLVAPLSLRARHHKHPRHAPPAPVVEEPPTPLDSLDRR